MSKVSVPGLKMFPGLEGYRAQVKCMPLITSLLKGSQRDWIGSHPGFRDFLVGDGGVTPLSMAVEVPE
jgi:hypothetical protein